LNISECNGYAGDKSAGPIGPDVLVQPPMKQLIITAEDFGLCKEVNEAVEAASGEGILSAASLMVSAPAAADAVARARRLPRLRVGLHVVLVDGRPTLPPAEIPALVDRNGAFPTSLAGAGIRWFFSPAARRQLEREVRAQFEAFRATGLAFDHVNVHNHMHVHPTLLRIVLRLAAGFGVRRIRFPYEPASLRRIGSRAPSFSERLGTLALLPWLNLMRHRIARAGMRHNDTLLGIGASGHLDEAAVVAMLERLPDGITEICFHPAVRRTDRLASMMPGYNNTAEFAALTSPVVAERLHALGLRPAGFADLR